MGAIEQHLDKQINALRNDLKISGQEAKLAKLRAEQAVISKKIASVGKHSAKKEKKSGVPVTKPSKHGQTLATAHAKAKDAEEPPAEDPPAEEAPAEEAPAEEAPAE